VIRILLQFVLVAALFSSASLGSAQGPDRAARTVPMHYEQREISQLVEVVARHTGRRYIFGDNLRGRVTITVPGRVSEDEAIALLNAALLLKGFAALPVGEDSTKIVALTETKSGAPLVDGPLDPERERPIATLIRLEHANVNNVAVALRPYVAATGAALPYGPTNSLILAGTEARVSRLLTIVRILDQAADESIMVRTLRHRSAEMMAEILRVKFNSGPVESKHAGIWSDERTNQIVVQAPPMKLEAMREVIREIDRPVEGEGLIRVVRILNRDADDVAALLEGMQRTSSGGGPQASTPALAAIRSDLVDRPYSVTVDSATRSLVLASDPETLGVLVEVVGLLDQLPPRIAVDVMILELVRPSGFNLGVDYFLPVLEPSSITDPAVFISSGASSILSSLTSATSLATGVPSGPAANESIFGRYTRAPLQLSLDPGVGDPITILVPREDVSFQAGEFSGETTILMRPHILAMSGEEHEIFVGNQIPVPTGSSSTDFGEVGVNGALSNRQIIERREVGIGLTVKPTVGQAGIVNLDLKLEISEIQSSIAGSVEQVGPTFTQRTIESTLRLSPGDYAVLGTSNGSGESYARVGIPYLMDIPFLGFFFGSVSTTKIENDLLIVVEARVMRSPSEDVADTIRRRIAMERAISRVADLGGLDSEPYAVLLETVDRASKAKLIAEAFSEDGFETEVTDWESTGGRLWDIYLTDFATFELASGVAERLYDVGWKPEVTVLSPENVLAGD
jgi:general secretion pathway protein D